ncbi:MAG: hypothetical protein HRU37_02340 [Roseibacillus sp.]|nr:hypothetical protein [Roseibacillus sp.]
MKNIVRMIAAGLLVAGGFSALSAQERGIDRPVPADILSVDDYRRAERRLKAGVEAGKISKEDAEKRLIEMRKRVEAGKRGGRPEGRGRPEGGENAQEKGISVEDYRRAEEKIKAAVEAGKVSKEDAEKRLIEMRKAVRGDKAKGKGRGFSVEDYRRAEKRMKAGIEAGKISKEDAEKRLIEMRKAIHSERGDGKKKDRDERGVKFRAIEEKTWAAVKAGKLSKDDAMKKLEDLKKEMFDDHGKKDWDGRKGSDVGIEALKRQLEALKRENEGLRKRLEKGKGR